MVVAALFRGTAQNEVIERESFIALIPLGLLAGREVRQDKSDCPGAEARSNIRLVPVPEGMVTREL